MKTESYFKEYNQFVIDQQKAIQELNKSVMHWRVNKVR